MTGIFKRLSLGLALLASCAPAFAQSRSLPRASPAVSSSYLVLAGPVYLSGINVTTGSTAGYVMLFDAATVPPDGAVTPLWCLPLGTSTGVDTNWRASPKHFQIGALIVFSTTGCYTKTASATAFLSGDIQ